MPEPKPQPASDADIQSNEPEKEIPGGARRLSSFVGRQEFPDIARREELNGLLLAHDPESAEEAMIQITEEDSALLRQIALEGAITGVEPAIRRNAITHLGRFPNGDNLDVLIDLSRSGEDPYVRGTALRALGRTGLRLAIDVVAGSLDATDRIEAQQAGLALKDLHSALGPAVLKRHLASETDGRLRRLLGDIIRSIEEPPPRAKQRRGPAADEAQG